MHQFEEQLAEMEGPDQSNPCAICLGSMAAGGGEAIFTAECSHTFHFRCISKSVAHGHNFCPLCKAQWRELPSVRLIPMPPAPPVPEESPAHPPTQPVGPVDSERVRLQVDESVAAARAAAERGAYREAALILENQQRVVLESGAARVGDPLTVELGTELLKMRRQMRASNQQYAYVPAYLAARMNSPTQPRADMPAARMSAPAPPRMAARISAPAPPRKAARMSCRFGPLTRQRANSRQKRQPPSTGSSSSGVRKRKAPNRRSQGRKSQ